jgi:hypothetical protein
MMNKKLKRSGNYFNIGIFAQKVNARFGQLKGQLKVSRVLISRTLSRGIRICRIVRIKLLVLSGKFEKSEYQKISQKLAKIFLQDNCGKIIKKLLNHLAIIILLIQKSIELRFIVAFQRVLSFLILPVQKLAAFGSLPVEQHARTSRAG